MPKENVAATMSSPGYRGIMNTFCIPEGRVSLGARLETLLNINCYRVAKPLAAIGIDCQLRVDRRSEGGGQQDVVINRAQVPRRRRLAFEYL